MNIYDPVESLVAVRVSDSEIPVYAIPLCDKEREALERFRSELAAMHRHEDTLLNNRLQGFLVATSLLVAAYAQFKEPKYAPLAVAISFVGICLAAITEHVLRRTARAIEWYIRTIRAVEQVLYSEDLRPYSTRRNRTPRHPIHISAILGVGLPLGSLALWLFLFLWALLILTGRS